MSMIRTAAVLAGGMALAGATGALLGSSDRNRPRDVPRIGDGITPSEWQRIGVGGLVGGAVLLPMGAAGAALAESATGASMIGRFGMALAVSGAIGASIGAGYVFGRSATN
jgi:hypothetical protein